jgi:hypothetical protein
MKEWHGFSYNPVYSASLSDIFSTAVVVEPDPTGMAVTTSWAP